MNRCLPAVLFVALALSIGCGGADTPIPDLPPARADLPEPAPLPGWRRAAIDTVLEGRVALGHRSGYVALVAREGRLVYAKTAGWRDVEAELPMTMDTRFRLASMTKPVTAVAAMILVEEGRLSLDDPVAKYLPGIGTMPVAALDEAGEVRSTRPAARPMLVRHLLSFSSGLGGGPLEQTPIAGRWREEGLYAQVGNLAERVEALSHLPLCEDPGTRWRYGASLDVMARIIEIVTGQEISVFMERRIFTPLGMHATRYGRDTPPWAIVANLYTQDASGDLIPAPGPVYKASDWTPGGSGLVGTATDYMRFALMLWNEGEYDGVRILAPDTVRRMRALEVPSGVLSVVGIEGLGFGLGVSVVADQEKTMMASRTGDFWWSGSRGTHFWVSPATGIVIVVLQQNAMGEHANTPVAPYLVQQLALVDRGS